MRKRIISILGFLIVLFLLDNSVDAVVSNTKPNSAVKTTTATSISDKDKDSYYRRYMYNLRKIIKENLPYTEQQLIDNEVVIKLEVDKKTNKVLNVFVKGKLPEVEKRACRGRLLTLNVPPFDMNYTQRFRGTNLGTNYTDYSEEYHYQISFSSFIKEISTASIHRRFDNSNLMMGIAQEMYALVLVDLEYNSNNSNNYEWTFKSSKIVKSSGDPIFDNDILRIIKDEKGFHVADNTFDTRNKIPVYLKFEVYDEGYYYNMHHWKLKVTCLPESAAKELLNPTNKNVQLSTVPTSSEDCSPTTNSSNSLSEAHSRAPGIDTRKNQSQDKSGNVDFMPYMKELNRHIKSIWNPPRVYESCRVVVLFKIGRNGELLTCKILKSSGIKEADAAALSAVKKAAPFRSLPYEYKGDSIEVQFIFDYR